MGREAASSPPRASANCLAISMFFCSLIPRPTETMISACVRSTACLASLKTSCGLLRMTPSAISTADGFDRSGAGASFDFVSAKCSVLESHEPRGVAGEADVGGELALEHLAGEEQLVAIFFVADAVADGGASHRGREFGDEVAHLIGVRHQHQLGLLGGDELFERGGEGVGSVGLELRRLDRVNLGDFSCARLRWRELRLPRPTTAASSVQPVSAARAWPAVRVSQETRFSLPSRCSTMTRIVNRP